MNKKVFLAFDLGAESGRALLGILQDHRLSLQEILRFPNRMITENYHLHWDVHRLYDSIIQGIQKSVSDSSAPLESLGIDTWGVDFSLVDARGKLAGNPYAYRDKRNEKAMKAFTGRMPKEKIYSLTGIQFMPFNSLFQLYALKRYDSSLLKKARKLLFMPDLFNFLLTGVAKTEFTIATTSQLYNPVKKAWEDELFEKLDVSQSLMQDIVPPGTDLGRISRSLQREKTLPDLTVCAVASHDTGSAVAAVPALDRDWCFISSGTWSIMGMELDEPIIDDRTFALNFTNEGGIGGRTRFSKNIMGLWLLQECRKAWAGEKLYTYDELMLMAELAEPFHSFVNPDWQEFLNPPDMPEAVMRFCRITDQSVPLTRPEMIRAILEGLAFRYRAVLDEIRSVSSRPVRRIHIIGGGGRNSLLCQFTADATGLPVLAGPFEATAVGNIMVQSMGRDGVRTPEEMREIISGSFEIKTYMPMDTETWDKAYGMFCQIAQELQEL